MAREQYTDDDLLECVEREIVQRKRVYPRLVGAGKMRQGEADRQIGMMARIADLIKERVQKSRLI